MHLHAPNCLSDRFRRRQPHYRTATVRTLRPHNYLLRAPPQSSFGDFHRHCLGGRNNPTGALKAVNLIGAKFGEALHQEMDRVIREMIPPEDIDIPSFFAMK